MLTMLTEDEIKELLLEMKRYVMYHGSGIGECVAWNKLKTAFGIDEAFEAEARQERSADDPGFPP